MSHARFTTATFILLGGSILSFSQTAVHSDFHHHGPRLTVQNSGTTNRLQAISPVNERV